MKIHAICLIFLLSASPSLLAQPSLSKESDEDLDKQIKSLDKRSEALQKEIKAQSEALQKQIKALQGQVDELRKKQDAVAAEQNRRAVERWDNERKSHFAKVEIRGKLKKAKTLKAVDKKSPLNPLSDKTYKAWEKVDCWQVVVNDRTWEVHFGEKDADLPAAAAKLIDKEVIIAGNAYCFQRQTMMSPMIGYSMMSSPMMGSPMMSGPMMGGPMMISPMMGYPMMMAPMMGYPSVFVFVVSADSLQPAPPTANERDRFILEATDRYRARVGVLSKKSDDVLTKREYDEMVGLQESLNKLAKEQRALRENGDKLSQYARVQVRGKVVRPGTDVRAPYHGNLYTPGADGWRIVVGLSPPPFKAAYEMPGELMSTTHVVALNAWRLNFGSKDELKALAREEELKGVVITGTLTADPQEPPTVNVESFKRAD